jgi:hypothetical protein
MADIMTSCPTLKVPVKTGLSTETIVFESLSSWIEVPFCCPACREVHRWARKDAWIGVLTVKCRRIKRTSAKLVKCRSRWSLTVLQFLSIALTSLHLAARIACADRAVV